MTSRAICGNDLEELSLERGRDLLTSGMIDAQIAQNVASIMASASSLQSDMSPLQGLHELIELIRTKPRGLARVSAMNAFVRTLGQPYHLALLLDHLKLAWSSNKEDDAQIARKSQTGRMHCLYGWSGQTLLIGSKPDPTDGTMTPIDSMTEFLGYPPARWDLSIHIWQPNPEAKAFEVPNLSEPKAVVEPPHSHPFDFVSYVAIGQMRQSIYVEDLLANTPLTSNGGRSNHRYGEALLERVDGVWPPHHQRTKARLKMVEDRVTLRAGDSYFMPYDAIHDVEVDRELANHAPAITLFLPSEAVVKPRVFIAQSMADYHEQNLDLKDRGQALVLEKWEQKLSAAAAYLRGESDTLQLAEIVRCGSTYGFMHQ